MVEQDVRQRRPRRVGAMSVAARSRADQPRTATLIYRELHDDIIAMRRKPNDPLPERDLLDHFGVSRTPLREALLRLADEGLVAIYPQVGTFVARIPLRVLYESIMIRRALELVMAEEAALRTNASIIARIDDNLSALDAAQRAGDIDAFHRTDSEFHRMIGDLSGRRTIIATVDTVRAQIDRYRLTTLPQAGRLARVVSEHRAIRDGLAARDPAATAQAMNLHIGQMLGELGTAGSAYPEYFLNDWEEQA